MGRVLCQGSYCRKIKKCAVCESEKITKRCRYFCFNTCPRYSQDNLISRDFAFAFSSIHVSLYPSLVVQFGCIPKTCNLTFTCTPRAFLRMQFDPI